MSNRYFSTVEFAVIGSVPFRFHASAIAAGTDSLRVQPFFLAVLSGEIIGGLFAQWLIHK